MVLFIPIDFSIEFWNCTFPLALKFLKGIFWTASARAFEWCKPQKRSYFRSKVINGFYRANLTWTYYSKLKNLKNCFNFTIIFGLSSICATKSGQTKSLKKLLQQGIYRGTCKWKLQFNGMRRSHWRNHSRKGNYGSC